MYVCMYVCMYVRMYVFMDVCTHVFMYLCMYILKYSYMLFVFVYSFQYLNANESNWMRSFYSPPFPACLYAYDSATTRVGEGEPLIRKPNTFNGHHISAGALGSGPLSPSSDHLTKEEWAPGYPVRLTCS